MRGAPVFNSNKDIRARTVGYDIVAAIAALLHVEHLILCGQLAVPDATEPMKGSTLWRRAPFPNKLQAPYNLVRHPFWLTQRNAFCH
jgi:hypothetical protein